MSQILHFERKRCEFLEEKISQKDERLREMEILQKGLYEDLEELKRKTAPYQKDYELVIKKHKADNENLEHKLKVKSEELLIKIKEIESISRINEVISKENSLVKSENLRVLENSKYLEEKVKDLELKLRDINKDYLKQIDIVTDLKRENFENNRKESSEIFESPNKSEIVILKSQIQELSSKIDTNDRYQEILRLLNAESTNDAIEKILKINESSLQLKTLKETFKKIGNLIVQCSPEGSFIKFPSPRQVYKWIIKLLEEYMSLKKSAIQ